MKTRLSIDGKRFRINGELTYTEIPGCPEKYHGLLMNQRMIQGVFCDKKDPSRFDRFGRKFDPEQNTDDLIAALPEWYEAGLRAITVGFQGGGPCFTISPQSIDTNPFSADGKDIDPACLRRMQKIIDAADTLGMVVIVSLFYGNQVQYLQDDEAIMEAVRTAGRWIREQAFTNVILEIANEHDIEPYKIHPILYHDDGVCELIAIAQQEVSDVPVGCSSTGAYFSESITKASDVVLIHGNNMTRGQLYNQIIQVQKVAGEKPVVVNEDSPAISQMRVAMDQGVSWGYYNNMTKQEPPTNWKILEGEDAFFAKRLSILLGIQPAEPVSEKDFYLAGLEKDITYEGKRWIRLASLYPEQIDKVEFFRNGAYFCTAYDDPFSIGFVFNWLQRPVKGIEDGENWKAVIYLADGRQYTKEART